MSKTAIVWLLIYLAGIFASFIKAPIYGLLTYMYVFYTQLSWAKGAGTYSWSLYASLAMALSYFLKGRSTTEALYVKIPNLKWLLLFFFNMLMLTTLAVDPVTHEANITAFAKLIILYYLIVKIINTKKRYKLFIWLQLWGNYFLGWLAYSEGDIVAGRLEGIGGPGMNTSNTLSSHILLFFPILGNLLLLGNKWEKLAVIISTPFIGNALVQCNSRGAFLGVGAMIVLSIFMTHKLIKNKMLIGIMIGLILFACLGLEKVMTRMETIQSYEEEGSAMGRVESWMRAIEMVKTYPLGKGGGGWKYYSPIYIPEIVEAYDGEPRSVHNTFLEAATDWGVQGLFLYLLFLCFTLLQLHKIRKIKETNDDIFFYTESTAIEIGLIGFLISAIFGVRLYSESLYWYCALATALYNIQYTELTMKKENLSCQ